MTSGFLTLSASGILARYKDGTLSPVDVMQSVLTEVDNLHPAFNVFAYQCDRNDMMQAAQDAAQRWAAGAPKGALDGLPVTVKDWYHIVGLPTRFGSLLSAADAQMEDAPLVSKLKAAGAIIIGKTTLPEYGHKGATFSPLTGVTRNPWNPDLTPGGSSGGAAVAAATGMGFLHIGSDAGGSIRIPASFSGVFGFKPTPGSVPHAPAGPFSQMSSAGPLTRTVRDAALLLDVIGPPSTGCYVDCLGADMPRLRIAYAPTLNGVVVDADIAHAVSRVAEQCRHFGDVDLVRLDIPMLVDTFNKHWMAVAAWAMQGYTADDEAKTDPRYLSWAKRGRALSSADYAGAQQQRLVIERQINDLLSRYDILITPTTAITAFEADQNMPMMPDGSRWEDWTPFTYPANLGKLPAASLPCGLDRQGLPMGVQVMAASGRDALVLQFCHALESKTEFNDWLSRQGWRTTATIEKDDMI